MADPSRAPVRGVAGLLFFGLFLTYAYFFQGGGWNQNSRFDLVRAIAEDGSVEIDRFADNTEDVARVGDRTLSNKAPGLSFLAAPAYLVGSPVIDRAGGSSDPYRRMSLKAHLLVILTVSLPSAILSLALYRFLIGWAGVTPTAALLCVLAYSLGTLSFPWSTQFMGHQTAAALLFGSAALIFSERRESHSGGPGPFVLSGLLAGSAVLVDETTVFAIPVLLIYVARTGGWRKGVFFCLGGLGPAVLYAVYNAVAFGGPLHTARHYQNPKFISDEGGLFLGVIGFPRLGRLLALTFLPRRGLFIYCPVLLFALVGLVLAARRKETRPEAITCLSIFGVTLLFNASFNGWHGGWSTGPRFLVPALPFLALGLPFVPPLFRKAAWAAACLSVVFMTAVTAVSVSVPQDLKNALTFPALGIQTAAEVENPLRNTILPRLARGELSSNPQHVLELYPGHRLSPEQARWSSYNLGEWLGLRGFGSLLPLFLLWGLLSAPLARRARRMETTTPSS